MLSACSNRLISFHAGCLHVMSEQKIYMHYSKAYKVIKRYNILIIQTLQLYHSLLNNKGNNIIADRTSNNNSNNHINDCNRSSL